MTGSPRTAARARGGRALARAGVPRRPARSASSTVPCSRTPARTALSTYSRLRASRHDGVDPLRWRSCASTRPAGPAPTIADLRAGPSSSRSRSKRAAWPWPTPTHIVASAVAAAAAAELVEQRDDEPGAAHPERVADRDRAAVDVHPLRRRGRARGRRRGSGTRTPRSARPGRASPTSTPARPSSFRTAGTGPIPITRGSTPATRARDEAAERLDRRARGPSPRRRSRAPRRRR